MSPLIGHQAVPNGLSGAAGAMSMVGPRPPLPREVDHYAPHLRQRLEVPSGITGLWQVSGRSSIKVFGRPVGDS